MGRRAVVVFLLLLAIAGQVTWANWTSSPTRDEPRYLGIGVYLLRHRTWDIDKALLHPPLTHYLSSLPLLPLRLPDELFHNRSGDQRGLAILALDPPDAILHRAR